MARGSSGQGKAADDKPADPTPEEEAAASPSVDDPQANDQNSAAPGFLGNSGPGTGQEPAEDNVQRMPTQQPVHSESGPLNPSDAKTQVEPKHGYADSSTDPTYAAAGGRTIAGEDHVGLVDDDGNDVSGDDLFDDSDSDANYVTVKNTVQQKFTYNNSPDHEQTRVLLNKGQRVPRAQAKKLKESLDKKQEPTFRQQQHDR